MGKYTVDEKVRYHEEYVTTGLGDKKAEFGSGYNAGVLLYRSWVREDKEGRALIDKIVATEKESAKYGVTSSKGFMCGMRDAARERKERQNKR